MPTNDDVGGGGDSDGPILPFQNTNPGHKYSTLKTISVFDGCVWNMIFMRFVENGLKRHFWMVKISELLFKLNFI